MIITVGGSAASGKTTLARALAERLKYKHVSAGGIMRKMAAERNQSLIDFSKYAEKNPEIDVEIDHRQKKLAKGNCVVDGRLSAYFIKADFNVWLTAPLEARAWRIRRRDGFKTLGDAVAHIKRREASEKKRYKKIYNLDYPDLAKYDLILNTARFDIPSTVEVVASAVKNLGK
jgi:cytidylate kinase